MKIRRPGIIGCIVVVALLLTLAIIETQRATAQKRPQTHQIKVNADGSFTPSVLRIREGDTVEWQLHSRTNAIIPAASEPRAGTCLTPRSYDPNDPNDFTVLLQERRRAFFPKLADPFPRFIGIHSAARR
ncbi:MAG TPA: hypothetical protein VFZ34_33485 [Blastocatellia bacterium]|nr:hypothetical protein [Blastocatellia bacterium]